MLSKSSAEFSRRSNSYENFVILKMFETENSNNVLTRRTFPMSVLISSCIVVDEKLEILVKVLEKLCFKNISSALQSSAIHETINKKKRRSSGKSLAESESKATERKLSDESRSSISLARTVLVESQNSRC